MPNVLIIGKGKVGNATAYSMPLLQADFHDPHKGLVVPNPKDYSHVIVCVDTLQSGPEDYHDLDLAIEYLNNFENVVVIRSTIDPNKALELNNKFKENLVMFPEFMDHHDFRNRTDSSSRTVLGGDSQTIKDFFKVMISYGYAPKEETFFVSIEEACIIKLSSNAALATKIILFNAIYQICQTYGIPYDSVRRAVAADKRIGIGHTIVPSPDDGLIGFGGHCLPKDIRSIAQLDRTGLFEYISKINAEFGR